jgi:hypothetical protein
MVPVVLHFPRSKSSFVEKAIQEEATERMLGSLGKRNLGKGKRSLRSFLSKMKWKGSSDWSR